MIIANFQFIFYSTLSSEDEMPSQIFAESNFKPASVGSTNGASSTADGEEEGTWYGSSSMEMDQLENTVGGGGDNDEDHGEDEVSVYWFAFGLP